MLRSRRLAAALALALLVPVAACSNETDRPELGATTSRDTPTSSSLATTTTQRNPWLVLIAEAAVDGEVPVFDTPNDGGTASHTFTNPTPIGAPLTFLVKADLDEWLQVYLPTRPNGSTGFVRRDTVVLKEHDYHITVDLAAFNLKAWKGEELLLDAPVGVAKENTPTPGGLYFITELVKPTNPSGAYGPYAYGLSGFSEVFETFNGGNGQLGIHGTNEPDKIGTQVSSGCVRLRNEDITKLVPHLPLGTPVEIITSA